jgi:hypothetical protein
MRRGTRTPRKRSTWLVVAFVVLALGAARPVYPAGERAEAAAIDCSARTARQLVDRFRLNSFDLPNPVAQVLCGSFTGPGSEAMAITIAAPTCWPVQRWAVLSFSASQWRLVLDQPAYLIPPLEAVGSDIKETTSVSRPGDPRCIPTGGTRARLWHWDGSKLVAGAWTQVDPGEPLKNSFFESPPAVAATCYMVDDGHQRRWSARASSSGRACTSRRRCCAATAQSRSVASPARPIAVTLAARATRDRHRCSRTARSKVVGRFRCQSLRTGIRCTLAKSGKGFVINRTRAGRVG